MVSAQLNPDELKKVLKEALVEALQEQRELFQEVFHDVLEDFALAKAIREGQETKTASCAEVFRILQDKS